MNTKPWDWNMVEDKAFWLDPCEESYYYANKWKREGRKSLLDLGCGLGRHSVLFANCGFKVTAMDLSDEALDHLKKLRREQGLNIACRKADMMDMPFSDDAFDCVFAMHSAGHCDTEGMKKVLSEIRRVLKPGGTVFMTLCSKESYTFLEQGLPHPDENTVIKTDGPEKGVPHFFADHDNIKELFADLSLIKVRLTDDCYYEGVWRNQKHYFIEASVEKEPHIYDYSGIIGRKVQCTVDRPMGTYHPRHREHFYPINYGYVNGVIGGDGAEQDVYILGVDKPLETFEGVVCAVYHRFNDNEDKWITVPEGMEHSFSKEEILEKIEFQERFFDGELVIE